MQLAFRAAKKINHKKVYAIDYRETSFDYDSVMKFIDTNRLPNFKKEIEDETKLVETESNKIFATNDLVKCLLYFNSENYRKTDIPWYVGKINDSDKLGPMLEHF